MKIELLNIDDKDFVQKLTKALGIKKGEKVEFITPQFKRTDGRIIEYFPQTKKEYECLQYLGEEELIKIGCQKWAIKDNITYWLFPGEWYSFIPNGLIVVDLNYEEEKFKKGITDDDIRFGALSFGFKQSIKN